MNYMKLCKTCGCEAFKWRTKCLKCINKETIEKAKKKKQEEKIKVRKEKAKVKKQNSISYLTKKADTIFSEYIRKRDCLLTTWTLERWICITCWEQKEYKQFDCWHFITRWNKSVRWDEYNCNLQCKVCNWWCWGRQYEHWIAIDKKYWSGTAEKLLVKSRTVFKLSPEILNTIIIAYTEKLNILLKENI